jgi:prepilin-type N-terminal cleavage/methylation domain-containing protein
MVSYRRQGGFTLLELVVGLVVLALLGAAAGYGLIGGTLAFSNTADGIQTLGKLRYASERMAREVREIRRNPGNPAEYDIATMNATNLVFTKSDGVTVTLTGTPPQVTLAYTTPSGTHTLTDEVSSLAFTYLQTDGTTAATGNADVGFIEVELVLARNGNNYPQRTRVALRNQQ